MSVENPNTLKKFTLRSKNKQIIEDKKRKGFPVQLLQDSPLIPATASPSSTDSVEARLRQKSLSNWEWAQAKGYRSQSKD